MMLTDMNIRVNVILGSYGMRCQEVDNFVGGESSITHSCENLVDGILWLGDSLVGGRQGEIRTASKELKAGSTTAVRDTDCTGKLNTVECMRTEVAPKSRICSHKSPKETPCLMAKGRCASMISSTPLLAAIVKFMLETQGFLRCSWDDIRKLASISE